MTTQIQPYKITISEVATIIPLISFIILIHIAIIIWVMVSQIYLLVQQIQAYLNSKSHSPTL